MAAPLDVLVIGGGIVGAGVARDAAMRGLKTGLVEQYDFAFGTSSRSSRLLHGGIRYLAQGRIGLVREASHEKHVLRRIAPHLAAPLAFLFPTYKGGPWPRWKLSLGVGIYDWLCGEGNLGRSSTLDRAETLAHQKDCALSDAGLTGAVRYFDGLTNDSRLVLDTLRSAAANGAMLLNYARLESAERMSTNRDGWKCVVKSSAFGHESISEIQARCVVSATGPWADKLPYNKMGLRLTKGVHLVVDRARLPVVDAVVMTEGSRILFAIPWGERVILGTTDTDYDAKSEDALAVVRASAEDIRYVLDVTNRHFRRAELTTRDVMSTWAGLRPLIANPNGTPSDISRAHEIRMSEPGWLEIAGGKLTTYRLMAEQAVNQIVRHLDANTRVSRTALEPLLDPEDVHGISGIVPPPVTRQIVEHFCRNEWAVHLDDVMVRRTSWTHYCKNSADVAAQVANWMAEILGWDAGRRNVELARYNASFNIAPKARSDNAIGL